MIKKITKLRFHDFTQHEELPIGIEESNVACRGGSMMHFSRLLISGRRLPKLNLE